MSYRFVDSFRAGPGWNCSKAVYKPWLLVGLIIKKFATMHGNTNVKKMLQYMVHVTLFPMIQSLYSYRGTSQVPLYDTIGIAFVVTFHTRAA
jgi:hypothetical protein